MNYKLRCGRARDTLGILLLHSTNSEDHAEKIYQVSEEEVSFAVSEKETSYGSDSRDAIRLSSMLILLVFFIVAIILLRSIFTE